MWNQTPGPVGDCDLAPGLQHGIDHVGEVEVARWNQLRDIRVVNVDTHADVEGHRRLLDVVLDEAVVRLDHPEVDIDVLAVGRDRETALVTAVEAHQLGEVERGEHVAVHRQEGLIQVFDHLQRARGPERGVLPDVAKLQSLGEVDAVQVRLDQPAEMSNRKVDPGPWCLKGYS